MKKDTLKHSLRSMSIAELHAKAAEYKHEAYNLRFQKVLAEPRISRFRVVRKAIAQILTEISMRTSTAKLSKISSK